MRGLLLLLTLALAACANRQNANVLNVSGRIEADEVDLAFKTAGRITTITVREGDQVKHGQVIARLAGLQEEARLKEAEARLASALARVNQGKLSVTTVEQRLRVSHIQEEQASSDARPRVKEAQDHWAALKAEWARSQADEAMVRADATRYAALAKKGAVPQQLADQFESRANASRAAVEAMARQVAAAESAVRVAEATLENSRIRAAEAHVTESQVDEARAGVKFAETDVSVAQAALDRAHADVEELVLIAPTDGTVITRTAEPGRVVSPGQVVLTIVGNVSLYLRGFVPVAQSDLIKVGQSAQVTLPSEASVAGLVARIDPQAMFTPENTYFKEERVKQVVGIKIAIKDASGKAKIGMPADGVITIQ